MNWTLVLIVTVITMGLVGIINGILQYKTNKMIIKEKSLDEIVKAANENNKCKINKK